MYIFVLHIISIYVLETELNFVGEARLVVLFFRIDFLCYLSCTVLLYEVGISSNFIFFPGQQ